MSELPRREMLALFRREERRGLRLAAIGHLAAVVAIALFFALATTWPLSAYPLAILAGFGLLALLRYWLSGSRSYRDWHAFPILFLEVALLTTALVYPNPFSSQEAWPRQAVFRYDNFVFFLVLLTTTAFSYRPALVAWTGAAVVICWGAISVAIIGWSETLTWSEAPPGMSREELLAFFHSPTFVSYEGRMKELLVVALCAGLLSAVVWRARRLIAREAALRHSRIAVMRTFSRFVPESVVDALVADEGGLAPRQRDATILFVDLADFTATVEQLDPAAAIGMLDAYFDAVGEVITGQRGVIYQFQGDGILAAFNLPVEDDGHCADAVAAARAIRDLMRTRDFAGQQLRARIGVATGAVVAGTVGGAARRDYTVHGDAVNLAARLEAMNKETGTDVLIDAATVAGISGDPAAAGLAALSSVEVRGRSAPVTLYTLT